MGNVSTFDHPVFATMDKCYQNKTLVKHAKKLSDITLLHDQVSGFSIESEEYVSQNIQTLKQLLVQVALGLAEIELEDEPTKPETIKQLEECKQLEKTLDKEIEDGKKSKPNADTVDVAYLNYCFEKRVSELIRNTLKDLQSIEQYEERKQSMWPKKLELMHLACMDGARRKPNSVPRHIQDYYMTLF